MTDCANGNRCYINCPVSKTYYAWHLNDHYNSALRKSTHFRLQKERLYAKRHWLVALLFRSNSVLKDAIYAFQKYYLDDVDTSEDQINRESIKQDLKIARETNEPDTVLRAYTRSWLFSSMINDGMAQIAYHELTLYCTPLNCHVLLCKRDGIEAFVTILFHPRLTEYCCRGDMTVYRGAVLTNESVLKGYAKDSIIITTTILSTSKKLAVASCFGKVDPRKPDEVSLLCTYHLHNHRRTAMDMGKFSHCPDDEEVLIYPYVPFRILSFERVTQLTGERRIEVILEEIGGDISGHV